MPHQRIRRYLRHGTLPQLAVFDASARLGSFSRAAAALHMAQPTVSAQIRKLTETVGLPLFEQIGRQIYLTEAGRRVHEHCRQVLDALADLDHALAALRGLERGTVRIAAGRTCAAPLMRAVAAFAARHPGLDVALAAHNRAELVARMEANADDVYVFANPPHDRDIVRQAIAPDPLVVVARAGHALAAARGIPLARLATEPFVLREPGSGTREAIEDAFGSLGATPRVRLEANDDDAVARAVMAGLGVALLPRRVLAGPEGAALVELDVAGFPRERMLCFVYPVGRELSPPAKAFMDFVRAEAHALVFAPSADSDATPAVAGSRA